MYVIVGIGVIIVVVLFLFSFFVGEHLAIKNGLILRKHGFYHVIPADEYFKLMSIQKKMSNSK
jgi:hypothetical protein